jgi:ubiquitin C-terminal hydrolase
MNEFINKQLIPLMDLIKRPSGWGYSPKCDGSEASQKYCGINNLGAICYMNSMMQQFFMIPALRYNLMCVDDLKEPNWAKTTVGGWNNKDIVDVDDNVLHQL